MTVSMDNLLKHKNILLLQGKMGTFFCRFASFLISKNKYVHKINFNLGDAFFYCHKKHMSNYRGQVKDFDNYIQAIIHKYDIQAVVCFNDCRPYHEIAKSICQKLNIAFFVFEEGYLRPDYITLEQNGINGYSQLDAKYIHTLNKSIEKPKYTANRFFLLCLSALIYYILVFFGQWLYPHYQHYRGLTIFREFWAWFVALVRKVVRLLPDKRLEEKLIQQKNFYLVSLQVHNDSQITHHSHYKNVEAFIEEVLISFAHFAPKNTTIVFKHHPLDRGHRDYTYFITKLANKLDVSQRVFYGCDMHLPSLIRASLGMITINSTTGLQSVYHKKPTKTMGKALYDIKGITDQKPLDEFWQNPTPPDYEFYLQFREYLIQQTQLNGSFYGYSPWIADYLKE